MPAALAQNLQAVPEGRSTSFLWIAAGLGSAPSFFSMAEIAVNASAGLVAAVLCVSASCVTHTQRS